MLRFHLQHCAHSRHNTLHRLLISSTHSIAMASSENLFKAKPFSVPSISIPPFSLQTLELFHSRRVLSSNNSSKPTSSLSPFSPRNSGFCYAARPKATPAVSSERSTPLSSRLSVLTKKLMKLGFEDCEYMPGQYNHLLCPMCKGGHSGVKSLSLQIKKDGNSAVWICFRGTCGWQGHTMAFVNAKPSNGKLNQTIKAQSSYGKLNQTVKAKNKELTEKNLELEPLSDEGPTSEVRDRLQAACGDKDSEATLTVPAAKSSEDDSIDIMPSPAKQTERCQSPIPSVATYVPGRIASGVFDELSLSIKRRFQQQLKKFIPKTEDDIANIRHEAEQIYEALSSFQADYSGLKNTVEAYLIEVGRYLKLKAQLEGRALTEDLLNKRTGLTDQLGEARALVEEVSAKFDETTTAIAQAYKRRKLLEAELERAKANELELRSRLAETEASLKKARDSVSLLEKEVADLDATPQVTVEDMAPVEAAKKRAYELLGALDA